jgi:hypothetical protein
VSDGLCFAPPPGMARATADCADGLPKTRMTRCHRLATAETIDPVPLSVCLPLHLRRLAALWRSEPHDRAA